jgi:hypothetical protein
VDIPAENRTLGEDGVRFARITGAVGLVAMLAAVVLAVLSPGGWQRFLHAYLVNFCFLLSLALGALFFVLLQHLTRSGWSVVLRRLAESIAGAMPMLALLAVPILLGVQVLYDWSRPEAVAADHLLQLKQAYLNVPFFALRMVVYFAVWVSLARFFRRTSIRQDSTGDVKLTLTMQKLSAPGMLLFALTVTFAAFDLLMSLEPNWYSTIFGVYYFSGCVVGFCALLAVSVALVQRSGRLTQAVTAEHYQDLGKLIFAFVVFWAYIAFSQYMLIWYANIPEETVWYLERQTGDWAYVSLALLFGHFVVPFLALISRYPKRRPRMLVVAAVWVLLMHWIDIYWLVMPGLTEGRASPHLQDLLCLVGLGGLCVAAVLYKMAAHSLVPERDPRLAESLAFENV